MVPKCKAFPWLCYLSILMQLELQSIIPSDMHGAGPAFAAAAPGRLDVIGGFADYSGARVLQMPISLKTNVKITLRQDGRFRVLSYLDKVRYQYQEVYLEDMRMAGSFSLAAAKDRLSAPENSWLAYVIGCFIILNLRKGIPVTGADITVRSEVPIGKGVSSSAALEVATLRALCTALGIALPGTELARLAQEVENQIVGAPCGLMDQLASHHGRERHLLPIVCQPDILEEPIPLPDDIHFIGIDSGIRHHITGASYADVRTAAFMGLAHWELATGKQIDCLASIRPSDWLSTLWYKVPEAETGAEFLSQFPNGVRDSLSTVAPQKTYGLRSCSAHPVMENYRAEVFQRLLASLPEQEASRVQVLHLLGEIMYQCHASYNLCDLGHSATDQLVDMVKADTTGHLFGAKITGGGSGGVVCVLARGAAGLAATKALMLRYQSATGRQSMIIQ